jgi:hypothetical protein
MAVLFALLVWTFWGEPSNQAPVESSPASSAFENRSEEKVNTAAELLKGKFQALMDSAKGYVKKMTASTCDHICTKRFQSCTANEYNSRLECESHRTTCFGDCQNPKPGVDYSVEE